RMTNRMTYTATNLTEWNSTRRGEVELDALARAYLGDPELTDPDRIAFALRELRKRGYQVEACPVEEMNPLMLWSQTEAPYYAFGVALPSARYKRLDRIAQQTCLMTWEDFKRLLTELSRRRPPSSLNGTILWSTRTNSFSEGTPHSQRLYS